MESKVSLTHEMPEQLTAQNIADRLRGVMKDWDLPQDKLSGIAHDNAFNMNLATSITNGSLDVPCFGHVLHLGVSS